MTSNSNELKQFVQVEVTLEFSLLSVGMALFTNMCLNIPMDNFTEYKKAHYTNNRTKNTKVKWRVEGTFYDLGKQQQQIPKYLPLPDLGNFEQKLRLFCFCSQLAHSSTLQ